MNNSKPKDGSPSRIKEWSISKWLGSVSGLLRTRREWNSKTPLQKWSFLRDIGKLCFDVTGFTIFKKDQKLHWYSYITTTYLMGAVALAIYTCCYFIMQGEFLKCANCTSFAILAFPNLIQVCAYTSKLRYRIYSLVGFAGRYIYNNNNLGRNENSRICTEHLDITVSSFFRKISVILLASCAGIIGTFYVYFTEGIKTSLTFYRIPFTEEGSDVEFWCYITYVLLIIIHRCLFNYTGIEVTTSIYGDVVTLLPKLVANDLKRLHEMRKDGELTEAQFVKFFKNIVKQILDIDSYVTEIAGILYWRSMVIPPVFTYSIGMAIYTQYALGFPAGYSLAIVSWVQLYYLCEVGEQFENNAMSAVLYDSNWYDFPIDCQKVIILLINRQQHRPGLNIGPFRVNLKMEIFGTITSKIYSFVMFLHNCFIE